MLLPLPLPLQLDSDVVGCESSQMLISALLKQLPAERSRSIKQNFQYSPSTILILILNMNRFPVLSSLHVCLMGYGIDKEGKACCVPVVSCLQHTVELQRRRPHLHHLLILISNDYCFAHNKKLHWRNVATSCYRNIQHLTL
jgi:hypothetical protein